MVYRAEIEPDILELVRTAAKARRMNPTALINSVLYDFTHGVRHIGTKSLEAPPVKVSVVEERKKAARLKNQDELIETFRKMWAKQPPEHFVMYRHKVLDYVAKRMFAAYYPQHDPADYFEEDTLEPINHLTFKFEAYRPRYNEIYREYLLAEGYDEKGAAMIMRDDYVQDVRDGAPWISYEALRNR